MGEKAVAWDDVVCLVWERRVRSLWAPAVVRLVGGEMWRVEVLGLSGRKVRVRSMAFGEREVPTAAIAALDFLPTLPPPAPWEKTATLYRDSGEPIPGQLLWLDRDRLAIDSPLGALTLSREGTRRYLFRAAPPGAAEADEVSLIDGTVLRGRAAPVAGRLVLRHRILGEVSLPEGLVRSVLRHLPGVVHLAEAKPSKVEAEPLLAEPALPAVLRYPEEGPSVGWPGRLRAVRSLRLEPKARMEFTLERGGRFRATIAPVERAKGAANLSITSAERKLLERTIAPDTEAFDIEAEVAPGALTIAVEFVPPMRFPCGVEFLDPHVVER